jgi:hypothetical protein
LDNKDIRELMSLVMREYLLDYPKTSILDVFNPASELGSLIKESTVCESLEHTSDDMDTYINAVSEELTQYFSGKEKKYSKGQLDVLYHGMFPIKEQTFEDPNDQQNHDNYEYELSEMRYATFFGTNRKWVDELIEKSSKG